VHIDGRKRMGFDHQGLGGLYPVRNWREGKYLSYKQKITIPKDAKSAQARILMGVFDEGAWKKRNENIRMKVTNGKETKVKIAQDGRLEVARIQIIGAKGKAGGASQADRSLRQYSIFRTPTPPVIDGRLNETSWRKAKPTRNFRDPNGRPLSGHERTRARFLWDAKHLYVGFTVEDRDIFNDFKGRDATLWKKDVVEVYLDPGRDGKDYVELQVSPTGEIFDAHFTSRRQPKWQTAALALTIPGMQAKIQAIGSINKRGDNISDRRWTVEIAIPWVQLPGVKGPPKDGEAWGVNLYRINAAGPGSRAFLAAWSPAGGDFHNWKGFGTVRFSKRDVAQRGIPRRPSPGRPGKGRFVPKKPGAGPVKIPTVKTVTLPRGPKAPQVRGIKTPTVKRPVTANPKPSVTPRKPRVRSVPAAKVAPPKGVKRPTATKTPKVKRPTVKSPPAVKKPTTR